MQTEHHESRKNSSFLVRGFEKFVDFGHEHFVLGNYLFRNNEYIFPKIEGMLLVLLFLCILILSGIQYLPYYAGLILCILLFQRILEYVIVYSRNFILHKGKIFTHFTSDTKRGQWLILIFFLNTLQILLIFAIWYKFISVHSPQAFSQALDTLNSFYFSFMTFLTVGYGDIVPIAPIAKILVLFQSTLFFYTIVIVINGLMFIHFKEIED